MPSTETALHHREFRASRQGHSLEECQDASAADPRTGRFAIADGAAESYSPQSWARLLVHTYVQATHVEPFRDGWLPALQQQWYNLTQDEEAQQLPYYLEERFRQGAFATFLGLSVDLSGTGGDEKRTPGSRPGFPYRWRAVAVGDSCLFQVRSGDLLEAFPLRHSTEFGNAPWLVGSRASGSDNGPQALEGMISARDRLWLMTDALAKWFLHQAEGGKKPWQQLELLLRADHPRHAFDSWIEDLRHSRQLRNDDVTLLAIYPEEG